MEPLVRYARTEDGVSIAYWAMGDGPPLLWMDLPYSHITAEWADASTHANYEANASVSTFIRFDHRGMGLSDRGERDFSIPKMLLDVEAVADRLELKRFALAAWRGINTPIAVAYAIKHPERLTHLVLAQGAARMPRVTHDAIAGLLGLSPDWRFVTESISRMVQGWDDDVASKQMAAMLRESMDKETFERLWEAAAAWDVRDLLPQVRTRTLLLHWKDHPFFGPEHGRELSAGLPNAVAAVIDGATARDRNLQYQATFRSFFGVGPPDAYVGDVVPSSRTAIVLFADIAGSTELTERLGDTTFRMKARDLDTALRERVRANGGTVIDAKTLGDGILATFPAAAQAIAAALSFESAASELGLGLHVGLHAGDVIREQDNVFGGAVNIAARISALAQPGEVLVSDVVRALARTSAGVTFETRGEQELKGVSEPQRVFAVRARATER
jgi:class 3 adenylate cyclase